MKSNKEEQQGSMREVEATIGHQGSMRTSEAMGLQARFEELKRIMQGMKAPGWFPEVRNALQKLKERYEKV